MVWTSARVFLVGLLLAAALLRVANIGLESLWLDEVFSLMLATGHAPTLQPAVSTVADVSRQYLDWQPVNLVGLVEVVRQDIHPALYFLVLNQWSALFGTSEAALRTLSAAGSWLLLIPVYLLGRTLGGPRTATCATLVAALSPAQLYYAQEARMYSLAMVFAAVSSLSLWKLLHTSRHTWWAMAYGASALAGILTHYVFVFVLAFHGVYLLVRIVRSPSRRYWVLLVPAGLLSLAVLMWPPLYTYPLRLLSALQAIWSGGLAGGAEDMLRWAYVAVRAPLRLVAGENLWAKVIYAVLVPLLVFPSFVDRWRRGLRWDTDGFLWMWLALPLAGMVLTDMALGSELSVAMRFTMFAAPPLYLLLGLGLARLTSGNPGRRGTAVLAAVLMLVVAVGTVSTWSPFRYSAKSNMRESAAYLDASLQAGDLVVVSGGIGAPQLLAYYLKPLRPDQPLLHWVPVDRAEPQPLPDPATLRRYRRVWLFDYRSRDGALGELSRHLDASVGPGTPVNSRLWLHQPVLSPDGPGEAGP